MATYPDSDQLKATDFEPSIPLSSCAAISLLELYDTPPRLPKSAVFAVSATPKCHSSPPNFPTKPTPESSPPAPGFCFMSLVHRLQATAPHARIRNGLPSIAHTTWPFSQKRTSIKTGVLVEQDRAIADMRNLRVPGQAMHFFSSSSGVPDILPGS